MRGRRTWKDKIAPDKFCFNHYLAIDGLALEYQSLYSAQNYALLVPVFAKSQDLIDEFYNQNDWIKSYILDFKVFKRNNRQIKKSLLLFFIQNALELVLNTWAGDFFEKLARWYQQRRIGNNPATYEPSGRVIFNDQELEFHPQSFERKLINDYNQKMGELGIEVDEPNSGLTTGF